MSRKDLNIFERVALEFLWAICWLIAHLPHFVHYYIFAPVVCFIFHRLIGYRRRVIDDNLRRSFPEKSESERAEIRRKFYVVFSEIAVGYIAMANRNAAYDIFPTIEDESDDPDRALLLRELTRGHSWIAMTAHFGMWEYFVMWPKFSDQRTLAVYHPLENKLADALFKRLRSHYKIDPLPAKESVRFIVKNGLEYKGESYTLGLIADQNPPLLPDSTWFRFLNQDTIFFEGGEKLARRASLPVYFAYQRRVGRGRYEFCYKPIWDGKEEVPPVEITRRYVVLLEQAIRENPHMWLWSHRRWKAKRGGRKAKWSEALDKK